MEYSKNVKSHYFSSKSNAGSAWFYTVMALKWDVDVVLIEVNETFLATKVSTGSIWK